MIDPPGYTPDQVPAFFWQIIADADHDRDSLRKMLGTMSREEMITFHLIFYDLSRELLDTPYTNHMAYASEDGAESLAEWVVSQGKEYFEKVWKTPAHFPPQMDSAMFKSSFEGIASRVFYERFKEGIQKVSGTAGSGIPRSRESK